MQRASLFFWYGFRAPNTAILQKLPRRIQVRLARSQKQKERERRLRGGRG